MAPRPPLDKRGITLSEDVPDDMELVDRDGKRVDPSAQAPSPLPSPRTAGPAVGQRPAGPVPPGAPPPRLSRALGPEDRRRLEALRAAQEQSARLLRAVRELLQEKGLLA